jgi:hypothetical protein
MPTAALSTRAVLPAAGARDSRGLAEVVDLPEPYGDLVPTGEIGDANPNALIPGSFLTHPSAASNLTSTGSTPRSVQLNDCSPFSLTRAHERDSTLPRGCPVVGRDDGLSHCRCGHHGTPSAIRDIGHTRGAKPSASRGEPIGSPHAVNTSPEITTGQIGTAAAHAVTA